eukprot:2678658-Amphidinium_carterae.2
MQFCKHRAFFPNDTKEAWVKGVLGFFREVCGATVPVHRIASALLDGGLDLQMGTFIWGFSTLFLDKAARAAAAKETVEKEWVNIIIESWSVAFMHVASKHHAAQ